MHFERTIHHSTAWALALGLALTMQLPLSPPAHAADALTVDSTASCAEFLALAGAVGSSSQGTCTVTGPAGAATPGVPADASVTIASGWTLVLDYGKDLSDFTVAGTITVVGALKVPAAWRASAAPPLRVTGELRNLGDADFHDSSLDHVAVRLVNGGRVTNSGTFAAGVDNLAAGLIVNGPGAVMEIGEMRHAATNAGRIENHGDLDFVNDRIDGYPVNTGDIVNAADGKLRMALTGSGRVDNAGLAHLYGESSGRVTNSGRLMVEEFTGRGVVKNSGSMSVIDMKVAAGGKLRNSGTLWLRGTLTIKGSARNSGRVVLACSDGSIRGKLTGSRPERGCPDLHVPVADVAASTKPAVTVSWEGVDGWLFDLSVRTITNTPSGPEAGPGTLVLSRAAATSTSFTGEAGETYEFRLLAYDVNGQAGNWTQPVATAFARDDRVAGSFGIGWTAKQTAKAFAGTYRVASGSGKRWTVTDTGRVFRVYGTTHKKGAKARVYVDGTYRKTITTYARKTHYRKQIFGVSLPWGEHTILVVSRASGGRNRLVIDAFALRR